MRPISRPRGFTLVELIIAMSVLAILISLAVPMYNTMVANNRARAAAYSLVSSLTFARDEAVKRNAAVSVLPFATGWQTGWEVDTGGLQLAINESNGLKRVPKHLMLARDEFVYRSYLAMGQYDIVFDEIKEGPNTPVGELGIYYLLFYH